PDPAKATGTEKEKLQAFRKVRNKIKDNLFELVQNYK
ncbi:MAG: arsenate reductase (thioredoxin), partial [Coriobacteriaceae bacterium]